jgi:perosamine synthetase
MHPYYRDTLRTEPGRFPVASREYERVISLPIWPDMTDRDLQRVVSALESVLGPAIR